MRLSGALITAREAVARGAISVRRVPESVAVRGTASACARSCVTSPAEAAARGADLRRTLTVHRLAWSAALLLAIALPFAANAARSGGSPAPAAVLEPPARAEAPAPPRLSKVAALPQPPRVVRRRPPAPAVTAPAPVATTPAPVETPVAAAPTPAPAPAPAPERKTFDLEG